MWSLPGRGRLAPKEGQRLYERMLRFGDELKKLGLLASSESLRSDTEGTGAQVGMARQFC